MTAHEIPGKRLFGFIGHLAAIVAGVVLMLIGLGMGVTVFLIPVGVPLGFLGFGMFLWGFFEHREQKRG